ncbi:diacylglycerol/lipid kinase family protein [Gemmatimonadota bacterium]
MTPADGGVDRDPLRGLVAIVHDLSRTRRARLMENALLGATAAQRFSVSRYPGEGSEGIRMQVERAIEDGAAVVVVGGGDGTFLRILNSLGDRTPTLLVPPLGTSNDYSRALGIRTVEEAVNALLAGRTRTVDLGRCSFQDSLGGTEERVFASSAGVGLVASMLQLETLPVIQLVRKIIRDLIYIPLSVAQILRTPTARMELEVNGETLNGSVTLLELAKVGDTGGLRPTPQATPDSGHFDICIAPGMSRRKMIGWFADLVRTRHLERPETVYFSESPDLNELGVGKVRHMRIVTDPPLPVHLHGEFQGFTPATFTLLPKAMEVFVPCPPPSG